MNMEYAIWLAERPNCSIMLKRQLIEFFGTSEAVWRATEKELGAMRTVGKAQLIALTEKDLTHANIILRDCEKSSIRVLSIEQEDYPMPLRGLPDAPLVLYVRGTMPDWENTLSIGIVGTRRATEYGLRTSRRLANGLAREGCVVVSGMARGIDGESSRGALDAGGTPVVVLGCGADVVYPPEHKDLMDEIIAHGAVITEYPPGTEPAGWHFPQRNRIMSGLSRGVLIIEAPFRSGALITADRALEQGRDVFAVPGNIDSKESMGVNHLLREGGAELVTGAADILAHYPELRKKLKARQAPRRRTRPPMRERRPVPTERPAPQAMPEQAKERPADSRPNGAQEAKTLPTLSEPEKVILEAVRNGADSVDAIVEKTEMRASGVLAGLTMLEINGYITRQGASVSLSK